MSTRILVASGVAVVALVAACSSSSSKNTTSAGAGGSSTRPSSAAAQGGAVTISMTGSTLTAADGRTLYENTVDTASKISCIGECATEWPPLTGTPKAAAGVDASKLGTATRPDGTKQVSFDGHPLYTFDQDKAAGEKKGDGIADGGGKWHVATASGAASSAPTSEDSSSSSYKY